MMPFMGIKIVESLHLTECAYVADDLNGYKPSKHRSARVKKKLLCGTKKKPPLVRPIMEERPSSKMYQLPTGELVGHPDTIRAVTQEMEWMGSLLGIGQASL